MPLINPAIAALGWLGRQGTRALALMVFVSIALPPLGALLKPYVAEAIFALLVLAFLMVEPAALRAQIARPGLALTVTAFAMIAMPALLGAVYRLTGLDALSPGLFLALMLQAATSPLMSSPAIASLLGLDAALILAAMIASTALVSLTAPVFMRIFAGDTLALAPLALGLRLFAMLAGAAALAAAIRWLMGRERVRRGKEQIDGINVIVLFIFVAALMGDIGARILSDPLLVAGLTLLAFALTAVQLALTYLVFLPAGRERAFAVGLMASQRNMGLMLAAVAGTVPDLTWLYFAIAQFPIYLLPQMLKPLAASLAGGRSRDGGHS